MGALSLMILMITVHIRERQVDWRQTEEDMEMRRMQCDHGGRDWNDVASSQTPLVATRARRGKEQISHYGTEGSKIMERINLCCFKPQTL